jgi:hypothetical protein
VLAAMVVLLLFRLLQRRARPPREIAEGK